MRKRILHITNWYPNRWNSHEAIFIKEHFSACINYTYGELWHVQVRNEGSFFKFYTGSYSSNEHYIILDTLINKWKINEIITIFLLFILRAKLGYNSWDMVNVHIAYPILRFFKVFKFIFGNRIIITEHWSAYNKKFYLKNKKAISRIQNIFHHQIPVISVSLSLINDIKEFSGRDDFKYKIIPNVVNPDVFYVNEMKKESNCIVFLMAGIWSPIKRPLLVMNAFKEMLLYFPAIKLRIIGCGQQLNEMKKFVSVNELENSIYFAGLLNKIEVAHEMRKADCFIHASEYETFSSVCAEALCCGIPVVASSVGGIPEFLNSLNGILVYQNDHASWVESLMSFINKRGSWDKSKISCDAKLRFNPEIIGSMFASAYDELI